MPETTIEELKEQLRNLNAHFAVFRDVAIAEIARLQYMLQPNSSGWPNFPAHDTALLERERAFRETLGLPMRDRIHGY